MRGCAQWSTATARCRRSFRAGADLVSPRGPATVGSVCVHFAMMKESLLARRCPVPRAADTQRSRTSVKVPLVARPSASPPWGWQRDRYELSSTGDHIMLHGKTPTPQSCRTTPALRARNLMAMACCRCCCNGARAARELREAFLTFLLSRYSIQAAPDVLLPPKLIWHGRHRRRFVASPNEVSHM